MVGRWFRNPLCDLGSAADPWGDAGGAVDGCIPHQGTCSGLLGFHQAQLVSAVFDS